MSFKKGNTVRLKSGGHTMTVYGVIQNEDGNDVVDVVCRWSSDGKVETDVFPEFMLEKMLSSKEDLDNLDWIGVVGVK
ncbi:DUF2158 domain-containing protein [Proteus columbae]|uniref:DUF2158 domain-containing protein n=1 Tax=Proteus columbae TaxID=1987580 RepID=UPI0028893A33|nr:DUF2158 domain-containing protein [Proteus columbae]